MSNTKRKEYWLPCPVCKGKTRTRVQDDTTLVNFPLYCPMMPPASKTELEEKLRQYLREECFAGLAEDRG